MLKMGLTGKCDFPIQVLGTSHFSVSGQEHYLSAGDTFVITVNLHKK